MMLHFIRPIFFLLLIPFAYLCYRAYVFKPTSRAWERICDAHLLKALTQQQTQDLPHGLLTLLSALFFLILAATGPAWQQLSSPLFQHSLPKIIVLDASKNMLAADLKPDRFQRGIFAAEDLLTTPHIAPIGFIAYTSEPFVVSPLTDDASTILSLLPTLTTDTPPVDGQDLSLALLEAATLIHQAKFQTGAILVLTGTEPNDKAIAEAKALAEQGITTSILPLIQTTPPEPFQTFATAGNGNIIPLTHLKRWATITTHSKHLIKQLQAQVPRWKDEGRWFILPALLLFLPGFRRGHIKGLER